MKFEINDNVWGYIKLDADDNMHNNCVPNDVYCFSRLFTARNFDIRAFVYMLT